MKPVFQTKYGKEKGNCFQACVASLFEMELEDVPDFCNHEPLEEWYESFILWLRDRGFSSIPVKIDKKNNLLRGSRYKDCFLIVSGNRKEDGVKHSTIYLHNECIHNPHKKCRGIIPDVIDIIFPLDPMKTISLSDTICLNQ